MRKNYGHTKIRSPQDILPAGNVLQSMWVKLRQTWEILSDIGDVITHSMDGYGEPQLLMYQWASYLDPASAYPIFGTPSITGSLVGISLIHSVSMGSLAATLSYPVEIYALIASR